MIVLACMALYNFISEIAMEDDDFDICDTNENYMSFLESSTSQETAENTHVKDEDQNMNAFSVSSMALFSIYFYVRSASNIMHLLVIVPDFFFSFYLYFFLVLR